MKKISILNIAKAFIFPVAVFFAHLFAMFVLRVYYFIPWIDIPAHFLGGFSIAVTGVLLLREMKRIEWYNNVHSFLSFIFVICFVGTIAVAWEFHEFLIDYFFDLHFQAGLVDTMTDLFLGLTGGVVGVCFWLKR